MRSALLLTCTSTDQLDARVLRSLAIVWVAVAVGLLLVGLVVLIVFLVEELWRW